MAYSQSFFLQDIEIFLVEHIQYFRDLAAVLQLL